MRLRLGLFVAMVIAVVVACWIGLRAGTPVGGATAPHPSKAQAASERATPELAGPRAEDREVVGDAIPVTQTLQRGLELHGSVEMLDASGAARDSSTGLDGGARAARIRWLLRDGEHTEVLEADVVDGVWSAAVDAPEHWASIAVLSLECDGKPCSIESPREPMSLPVDGRIDVLARVAAPTILHVVDGRTGAQLSGVTLVRTADAQGDSVRHPGANYALRIVLQDATSPIEVTSAWSSSRPLAARSFLVGVASYAWSRVDLDLARGGERVVELEPGGDLAIDVSGAPAGRPVELRVRTVDDARVVATLSAITDGVHELLGLPGGPFVVRAELGAWHEEVTVLAEVPVTISAGSLTRVALDVVALPTPAHADVRVRLFLPKAWEVAVPQLTLERIDAPLEHDAALRSKSAERVEPGGDGDTDTYTATIERVQPGRHRLSLRQPRTTIEIEVAPNSNAEYELRVPQPNEVLVRVVEDPSGRSVTGVQLYWEAEDSGGARAGGVAPSRYDADLGAYWVRVPERPLVIAVQELRYLPASGRIDPSRGERELTLRVAAACGFVLALRDGDTPVPLPATWFGMPKAIEGTRGEASLAQPLRGEFRVSVTAPGVYSIELPKLYGYQQPPTQRIEARAGEFTKHVVELVREQH